MQYVFLLILMIAVVEACAQFCLKKGSEGENKLLYFIGFASYGIVSFLLLKSYSYKGIVYCNLVWSILSILFACISGKIFFGEKINYLAILLTLAAIYVVNKEDNQDNN